MSYRQQQEAEQERYQHNVYALVECLMKGVNEQSVHQLAFEAGVEWKVIESFLPNLEKQSA